MSVRQACMMESKAGRIIGHRPNRVSMGLSDIFNEICIVPQVIGTLILVHSNRVGDVRITVLKLRYPMGSCDFNCQRVCLSGHGCAGHFYSVQQHILKPSWNGPVVAKGVCPDDNAAHPMRPADQIFYGIGGQPLIGDAVGKKNEEMAFRAVLLNPLENDKIRKPRSEHFDFGDRPPPVMLREGDPCKLHLQSLATQRRRGTLTAGGISGSVRMKIVPSPPNWGGEGKSLPRT